MYARSDKGVFRTENRGATWQSVLINSTVATSLNAFQGNLYAEISQGFFSSANNGQTWSSTNANLLGDIVALGNTLYVVRGTKLIPFRSAFLLPILADGKLYSSTTGGLSWNKIDISQRFYGDDLPITAMTKFQNQIIVARYFGEHSFLKSFISASTNGTTWTQLDSVFIPEDFLIYSNRVCLNSFTVANNRLFASGINLLPFFSVDRFSSFGQNLWMLDSTMQAWQIMPRIPVHTLTNCGNTLFGAANLALVQVTEYIFTVAVSFVLTHKPLFQAALEIISAHHVAVIFFPSEIRSWCFNPLFPTFDADGYLYVYDNGGYLNTVQARIYRSSEPLCGTRVAVQEERRLSNTLNSDVARIIPNPATNYATLHYKLTEAHFVRVELFSLLEQRMTTFFEGRQLAGEHTLSLPLHTIPRGMYVCRLWAGETSKSLRLIAQD